MQRKEKIEFEEKERERKEFDQYVELIYIELIHTSEIRKAFFSHIVQFFIL